MATGWAEWFRGKSVPPAEVESARQELLAKTPPPRLWLFGKTGSGKTSIVRYLTGADAAVIGNGFRPQTTHSSEYVFPDEQNPVISFIDTRGLGEARYDAQEDLAQFDADTHLMIVTARLMDHAQAEVVEPLQRFRRARPRRPVLLVLTCLHEAYSGEQHPAPDPFESTSDRSRWPSDAARSFAAQQHQFDGLVDRTIAIDLTQPSEGFLEPNLGGRRLERAIVDLLPQAYRMAFGSLGSALAEIQDLTERSAQPLIWSHAGMAATAGASPLPWVDIPVVMGLQAHLVYRIAKLYRQEIDGDAASKMFAAIGGRLLLRFAVRAPLKLIPVAGHAANAAMSFAYTLSLGKACCWYFGRRRQGLAPTQEEMEAVWSGQLQSALDRWAALRP